MEETADDEWTLYSSSSSPPMMMTDDDSDSEPYGEVVVWHGDYIIGGVCLVRRRSEALEASRPKGGELMDDDEYNIDKVE